MLRDGDEEMRFLVLQKVRAQASVKDLAALFPAQIRYYEELQASGKVEAYYHLIGQQGHMVICNVNSDEELSSIIGRDPLFFQSQREVCPLTTAQTHRKQMEQLLARGR